MIVILLILHFSRYLNEPSLDQKKIETEIEQVDVFLNAMNKIQRSLSSDCINKKFLIPMNDTKAILKGIITFLSHQFHEWNYLYVSPYRQKFFSKVLEDLGQMKQHIKPNQTMAFMDEFETDVYRKPLLTRPTYQFVQKSKIIYDFESYVLAKFSVIYPLQCRELR